MAESLLSPESAAPEPVFPRFKPLALADREIIRPILWDFQPETSELTFTNLFIWQSHYGYRWSRDRDRLIVVGAVPGGQAWALPPVGPGPRADLCRQVLGWLKDECGLADPAIERADPRLAAELAGHPDFLVEPLRNHFDYVYRTGDLINLAGGNYQAQRNHINSLARSHPFRYEPLREEHLSACLYLCARWCQVKRCECDLSLLGEWEAVTAALANYQALQLQGGVILIHDQVRVSRKVMSYILNICIATRPRDTYAAQKLNADIHQYIRLGASPRASESLLALAKSFAFSQHRDFVNFDDVSTCARHVLRHRILLNSTALSQQISADMLVREILKIIEPY